MPISQRDGAVCGNPSRIDDLNVLLVPIRKAFVNFCKKSLTLKDCQYLSSSFRNFKQMVCFGGSHRERLLNHDFLWCKR